MDALTSNPFLRVFFITFLFIFPTTHGWQSSRLSQSAGQSSGRPDDRKPVDRSRETTVPPKPPPPKPPPPKPPPVASLTVTVHPADSTITLDNKEFGNADAEGTMTFNKLKASAHLIVVRREGYRDRSVTLTTPGGENTAIKIALDPLPGKLRVEPSVAGAQIRVKSLDSNRDLISRSGLLDDFEVPPGDYEVIVSKSGYKTLTRTVTIHPAKGLSLEPRLDVMEIPRPPRPPAPAPPRIPITSSVENAGKYLIVRLRGASGNAGAVGSINVMASKETSGLMQLEGSLTGYPCEIEFVRMQNVAEAALVETPGPSNQWANVAIRVRPKDSKRMVHFVINWRSLAKTPINQQF